MQRYPKITVVTPSYNQGQFLEETILSVLSQNYPNLEYIIIDGGSTDNSVEIIRKYADRLYYWVSAPDKGQTDAINRGFSIATGEILAELDADDVHFSKTLNNVASFFQANPDIGCVFGDLALIGPNSECFLIVKSIPFKLRRMLYGGSSIPQPATFFTRRALEVTGEMDTNLHYEMDYEFFLRMAIRGVRFGRIKRPLAGYRLHRLSKTVSEYAKFNEGSYKVRSKYSSLWLGHDRLTRVGFIVLKWFYRMEAYFMRVITRGDWFPFRVTYIRRSLAKGKYPCLLRRDPRYLWF